MQKLPRQCRIFRLNRMCSSDASDARHLVRHNRSLALRLIYGRHFTRRALSVGNCNRPSKRSFSMGHRSASSTTFLSVRRKSNLPSMKSFKNASKISSVVRSPSEYSATAFKRGPNAKMTTALFDRLTHHFDITDTSVEWKSGLRRRSTIPVQVPLAQLGVNPGPRPVIVSHFDFESAPAWHAPALERLANSEGDAPEA